MSTATRVDRNRHWVQRFKFVYDGTEIGKRGNTFAFELVFPSNCLDDLAYNLSQPTQGMGFVERDRIGGRRQEVAAFADQRLQVQFNGLPVEQDGRTSIPAVFEFGSRSSVATSVLAALWRDRA